MRVDAYNQVTQIYSANNKFKTQRTTKGSFRDRLEISSLGKTYQTAKAAVQSAADIRQDKVTDIKRRIDNGTYDVSSESFADKILEKYSAL